MNLGYKSLEQKTYADYFKNKFKKDLEKNIRNNLVLVFLKRSCFFYERENRFFLKEL